MEIENPMVLPEIEYNTDWDKFYDVMAEKDDREWEDECFE